MRILGIESSSLVASVAVVTDDVVTAEYTVNFKKTHSQTLLPMLDEIVRMVELPLESVDAVAVSGGPGSFTGLRIGLAAVKGLAFPRETLCAPVSTLEALAAQVNISVSQLKRTYKDQTGSSVIAYLTKVRISEAKRLIRESNHNFTQIAELTGYDNIYYFSRRFKEETKMTPTEYALSLRR